MDNQERAYSPAKVPLQSSDHYPRGFYGTDQQAYHDGNHGTMPMQVGGYQIGSTGQSYQLPAVSVHPPSGAFHHQMPSQVGTLHPQPAVGLLRPSAQPLPLTVATQPVTLSQNVPQTMASQAHIAQMYPWMQPGGGNAPSTDSQMSQTVQQQQFQRLKVEDALSYLDQVKLQFSGHPQVYNDFLDIMKEFKSQSIDTPGVIKRVSSLFRGHPDLIVGFNTFLPPGYKIAVDTNETISVEQPGQQAMSLSMFSTNLPPQMPAKPAHLTNPHLPEPLPTLQTMTSGLQSASSGSATTGPPVEFNHAIQYVNKIKVCYQNQPEIYKSFLDILHKYQNEQKMLKEGTAFPQGYRPLTEVEVYALVTELFKDQPQLLAEFSQFLPDASGIAAESALARFRNDCPPVPVSSKPLSTAKVSRTAHQGRAQPPTAGPRNVSQPPVKKPKMFTKENTFPESDKPAIAGELSFFEKMRDDMSEQDYSEFVRCIELYMKQQVMSFSELLIMIQPLINRMPDLRTHLLEFLRQRDENAYIDSTSQLKPEISDKSTLKATYMVDLSTCKEEAVSYRLLPKSYTHPICSGRSELCDEVLNDTYALHPSWPDDMINLGLHRKNQYEEHMYQCEDERYELDMVLEINSMAKNALTSVMTRLKNFTNPEDVSRFRLDDTLGGNSEVLMHVALNRLYGDKTAGIIEGLKCNPAAAVPIVLRRLVAKEKEWRTAQHGFHRIWREQNERYYLRSLDHQAAKFKQNDVKQIRSKTLMKEIEAEMQENPKGDASILTGGLHVNVCRDTSILRDAASLIIHHVRRQSALQPDDKSRVRHVLFSLIPDLLRLSLPLPPDLGKEDDEEEIMNTEDKVNNSSQETECNHLTNGTDGLNSCKPVKDDDKMATVDTIDASSSNTLFYGSDNWYYFMRLYTMLCERLKYFSGVAAQLIKEEMHYQSLRSTAVSAALKLRNPNAVDVRDSYGCFLELVRSLLEGNVELSSFEDQLRDMFGIHAYVAFTVDKLIQNITRQLQYIVTKDVCWQLVTLYEKYSKLGNSDAEMASYQKEAEQAISDDKCFRVSVNIEKTEMTIEYIELSNSSSSDEQEQSVAEPEIVPEAVVKDVDGSRPRKPTFLKRNLRRAHTVRRKQMPDGDEGKIDSGIPPSCIQLLNVESSGACLYTCGALTNAKQVCGIITHVMNELRNVRLCNAVHVLLYKSINDKF